MKKFAIALVGMTAFSSPALAQEAGDSGWYLALKTGIADLNNPDFVISDPDNRLDTKLETKSAWAIAGETGYDFGDFRFGVEVKYQRNKVKGIDFRSFNGEALADDDIEELFSDLVDAEIIDPDAADNLEIDGTTVRATSGSLAKLRQVGVMANMTYDIPLNGMFSPYIGGGLGAVGTHLKAFGEDDGSVRFAWQVLAGASVNVSPNFAITADYSYRQTSGGKLQFGDDEDFEYRLGKTKASFFTVGARLTF